MREKIGILFPSVDHSQRVYQATVSAHQLLDSRNDVDIVFFYEGLSNAFITQRFGTAHVSHMYSFDGTLISTDAHSARRILGVITSKKKIYYPMDIDWKLNPPIPYEYLVGIYRDGDIEVVARSESHQWAIENAFNRPVRVVEDFNIEELISGKVQSFNGITQERISR